jgi:uncharacterized membrane protein YgcG
MKRSLFFFFAVIFAAPAPALAADFVHDQAGMFGAQTVEQLDTRIGNFNAQTGKEIVVDTVDSVPGGDVRTAAQKAFAQQNVNGVLIFIDKGDRQDWIAPDQAAVQAGWWNSETSQSIAQAMQSQFKAGDFDGGITTAVAMALNVYRSHLGSLPGSQPSYANGGRQAQQTSSGVHINVFWWIMIALFGFFIIRSIMRASMMGGGYYGRPGYGAGGYGPGYGYGPGWGGGGFLSGMLGGLGGYWLGSELFGGGQNAGMGAWGNQAAGGAPPADAGGWQSDPGQAALGGGGGGDWGGGGFGGGDMGGGGGFGGGDVGGGAGGGW